ncbi:MAG: DinB family protein [Phycisphaerales bacterium]
MPNTRYATDPVEVMLAHNSWANELLIKACEPLGDTQLDQPFEMGLGSLRLTITHIFGAMRGWTDFLAKRPQRERLESTPELGPARWIEMMPELDRDLRAAVLSGPLDEVISAERGDRTFSFVRSHVVVHVTTHGVHHRAQCQNMLRHLGVSDLPASSGMEWGMEQLES